MQPWRLVGLAVALLVPARGYSAPAEPPFEDLVRLYRSGDHQRSVGLAALWEQGTVEAETRRLLRAPTSRDDAEAGEALRLGAAAILTESALRHCRGGQSVRARPELDAAARLVKSRPLGARGRVFARRFYLMAGLTLQAYVDLGASYEFVEKALDRDPDDPELLTALGSMIETVASLRRYDLPSAADAGPDTRVSRGYRSEAGGGGSLPRTSLPQAEGHYEKALALDPGLVEARLRLGRVRLLRGRPEQALPDLERVAGEGRQRERYLARLFEGRAREELGDVAGAAAAFRAASADAPRAQTALLALGRSLDRLGDTGGAQEALARASEARSAFDPWWTYQSGRPERVDELAVELRGLVQ